MYYRIYFEKFYLFKDWFQLLNLKYFFILENLKLKRKAKMQTLKNLAGYVSSGYSYVVNETWQLGSDTVKDVGVLYSEVVGTASNAVYDMATATWETTERQVDVEQVVIMEKENITVREETPVEKIDDKENKDGVKLEVFSVDTYSTKSTPAIIEVSKNSEENKAIQQ